MKFSCVCCDDDSHQFLKVLRIHRCYHCACIARNCIKSVGQVWSREQTVYTASKLTNKMYQYVFSIQSFFSVQALRIASTRIFIYAVCIKIYTWHLFTTVIIVTCEQLMPSDSAHRHVSGDGLKGAASCLARACTEHSRIHVRLKVCRCHLLRVTIKLYYFSQVCWTLPRPMNFAGNSTGWLSMELSHYTPKTHLHIHCKMNPVKLNTNATETTFTAGTKYYNGTHICFPASLCYISDWMTWKAKELIGSPQSAHSPSWMVRIS